MAIIELNEWMPDQPELGNPGCIQALNCLPAPRGFRPLAGPAIVSAAIDGQALGGHATTDTAGDSQIYVGNDTKLYVSNGTAFDDKSKAGGYTATAVLWDFTNYGEIEIATNYVDNPQYRDVDTATAFADLTTAFKARYVDTVRDFVVFGNTFDGTDGAVPNRLRWSALGDYTDYTVSATTQSDFQDTPGGGAIQAVFGGEYGVVFFERSIVRISYVGSPLVFQFDDVAPDKGLYTPNAAARDGERIYFLDNDGFYVISGGQQVTPVGNEKVDQWFFSELDASKSSRIRAAIDHENTFVAWSFQSKTAANDQPDRIIIYDFEIGRWSYAEIEHDIIFSVLSEGYTLESLDALTTNIEGATMSVDARIQFEGFKALGVMVSNALNLLAGENLDAEFITKETQESPRERTIITEVWPLIDEGTTTVEVGTRNRQQDTTVSYGAVTSLNAVGFAPVRANGRYTRIRMKCTGDWTIAQGCETVTANAGVR